MMALQTAPLAEIADVVRGVTFSKSEAAAHPAKGMLPVLRAGNIQDRLVLDEDLVFVPQERVRQRQIIRRGDIVICTSSGSSEVVGKTALAEADWAGSFGAFCAGIRAKPSRADPAYLFHYLRSPVFRAWTQKSAGANIKNIRKSELDLFEVPIPPLPEQRRIADILNKAEGIRRKREQALAMANKLLHSVFTKMFGDPRNNPKAFEVMPFSNVLSSGMRNGISPSSKGKVSAQVLTLSAITGSRFDGTQRKEGKFLVPIAENDQVSRDDFYICRGNGSPELVGKGFFAGASMPGVAFPDTMIAAKPDFEKVTRGFLEAIWNSPFVRTQIINAARTTNGTYKINQSATGAVSFPVPPINEQREFDRFVARVRSVQQKLSTETLLFESLLQRAFRGEL